MRKNKKNDTLLKIFKLYYGDIFLNKDFSNCKSKHFDTKSGFACFLLGFIQNQIGYKKIKRHIEINKSEWLKLFFDIYDDNKIKETFSKWTLNPVVSFDTIVKDFDCFNPIIEKIVQYLGQEQINLNINIDQVKWIIKTAFGYIMYNCIDCKMYYKLIDILSDVEYDQKVSIITNNTKLFALAKEAIVCNCKSKISDLITLLLAISRDLNYDY